MPHLPQPARSRSFAFAKTARRARRAPHIEKSLKDTTAIETVAASESLEAAPEMLATDTSEG